ncbi:odorant receptor 13a-like [Contarinia nasturtii]|uniref:odorant receptor 13a-like n=1 Tax=Contarinia nasturtii TaxID=265458 RepID=UPI0012D3B996|nr:odorant receptor 13a-like [Contarinia nasturtii]
MQMILSQYVCLITPVIFLIPLLTYFVLNITDVAEATSAFYLICITGMGLTTYSEFWIKRTSALSIIYRIQQIVDNSVEKFKPFYMQNEVLAYKIVYSFRIFVFCSVFGVVSLPLCILIILWVTGNYTDDMRILPAALQLPIDVEQWPGYLVGYGLCYLAAYFVSLTSGLYVFFISVSLYIKAALDEIRFKLKTINQNHPKSDIRLQPNGNCEIQQQLIGIVKAHLSVLDLLRELDFFLIRIKYYIFSFGAATLCTGLFQLQQSALNGNQMLFQLFAACSCDILVLFMFCLGGEIIIDAYDVSNSVYQLNWYQFDSNSKYMVWFMIGHSQKPYYFASFKSINCSLETFTEIIRKAGAVLAMLQSMK